MIKITTDPTTNSAARAADDHTKNAAEQEMTAELKKQEKEEAAKLYPGIKPKIAAIVNEADEKLREWLKRPLSERVKKKIDQFDPFDLLMTPFVPK